MTKQIINLLLLFCYIATAEAQIPLPIKQLLNAPYMRGAAFSLVVKDIGSGKIVYSYDTERQMTPASVMKVVTTATALEILGKDYRYPTSLEYDGEIIEGTLHGNLYIKGSGDPTLGSSHFADDRNAYSPDQNTFIPQWLTALRKEGIKKIEGAVIADESIFDTEGTSLKWLGEDLGSYYGAGSYGLCAFDNLYKLFLKTGGIGSTPQIRGCEPVITPGIRFHNYLKAAAVSSDSSFITGSPLISERYLYGIVPANREWYTLKGDIPDPALFLAGYLTKQLEKAGITISGSPSCYRIESADGKWKGGKKQTLVTTYSPPLKEIVRITNGVSHNLFADALLKTIGLTYKPRPGEVISSFDCGIRVLQSHWREKGMDISSLWMYDGSGLAMADKISASLIADILSYMAGNSQVSEVFINSFPRAGLEGSVRNFLKGTSLQGKARIKSGSMSRVKGYAGYLSQGEKQYAIAIFVNNYSCDGRPMTQALERLLIALFE